MSEAGLRIAFVVHDYHRHGGHSRYVAELATRFRRDHQVHVFANVIDDADADRIIFHHVPAWRKSALTTVLSFLVPGTMLVRGGFDIVHAQGLCGLRHNLATAHICQSAWFDALKQAGKQLTWRQRLFQRLVTGLEQRALCQSATRRVIAVSQRIKADIARRYGRAQGIDVIYHGTDTNRFHPEIRSRWCNRVRAELGIGQDCFVAIYVGDLQKGAGAALDAVRMTAGVTLLFVSGSDAAPYRLLADRMGITERVIFHPASRQVESLLAVADAMVFPTVYDSFGLVITEAMASALPVITSRAAGASELITHEVDGLLTAEPWDAPTIAEHLAQLRDDSVMRERIGNAARRRIEPLTWDSTAEQTLAVYRQAVTEMRA
jgi:UDP-glucose:(heptosyl)LPS alpha-1,3-glucosyltransferase